jgi:hypothetical protein
MVNNNAFSIFFLNTCNFRFACTVFLTVLSLNLSIVFCKNNHQHQPEYIHEWALKVSDPLEADLIAAETGFINKGVIEPFTDIYLFQNPRVPHRSRRSAQVHTDKLNNHEKVLWAEQQVTKLRTKRDMVDLEVENKAYRSIKYDDPEWNNQWYLVRKPNYFILNFYLKEKLPIHND